MSIERRDDGGFILSGGDVSYVLGIRNGQLINLYWGKRVGKDAILPDTSDYDGMSSFDMSQNWLPREQPTLGQGWYGTPAVGVIQKAGNQVTSLQVADARIFEGKPQLSGLPQTYAEQDHEAQTLEVDLLDPLTQLQVTAQYTIFEETGALTRSLILRNLGTSSVHIHALMPASVLLWGHDYDLIHLKGAWARERQVVRTPLGEGSYEIESQRGASGHEENPFLALCRKNTDEQQGDVYAANFVYSGSFSASARVDNAGNTRLSLGMNQTTFSWMLAPGEIFQSPETVLVYSAHGLNGMSQIFHALYRTRLARGYWRDRQRPILLNNWEATYFDFTEEKLLTLAREAARLGVELFVLDDGWFGKRNSDNCSLGDWIEDKEKLPDGLHGLSDKIHNLGLMFGIWVEPEMVSPDSDLYRLHPDWCLHVPGRDRTEGRNQLVLDMSREDVQQYIISAISDVLQRGNADYVKWDMNRNMTEYFSASLPSERQMETQHRYILGLYRVMDEITSRFPKVLFESCSGGGGRFDAGMLYYMPQTWTSDNTDAVSRLFIQYGTSMVYPPCTMGAHISAVPNHQTGRKTSVQMRADTALCGNFGLELDLTKLTAEDKTAIAAAIDKVKSIRHITQSGTFTRLLSPYEGQCCAWQFAQEDQVLLCVYQILTQPNVPPVRIKMSGLDENAMYCLENGRAYSGAFLMYRGFSVRMTGDFESCTFLFQRKNSK